MAVENSESEGAEVKSGVASLEALSPYRGAKKRRKRVGTGAGSGLGKTCGKGQKGQRSRSGVSIPAGFEGGQMPLHRRLPKRGFVSRKRVRGENVFALVSLSQLETLAEQEEGGEITLALLKEKGYLRGRSGRVKILANGEINKKLTVEAHAASRAARAAIEAAGGQLRIVA